MEDNTALEFIHTVAATYGCQILQLYKYEANDNIHEAKCKGYSPKYQFMQDKRQKIIELSLSALSEQYMFQN